MFSPLTQQLIEALQCLPGIGPKSAQRMAFHLLEDTNKPQGQKLADALSSALMHIKHCQQCRMYTEEPVCRICQNTKRDHSLICVVESPADIVAFEQTQSFNGVYFVLMGHLSPLDGIGPADIGIPQLTERLKTNTVSELILATNPTMEGKATAHYINAIAAQHNVRCSQLAHGVPIGGELEYLDGNTIAHALKTRDLLTID